MTLFSAEELRAAQQRVYQDMQATPQYVWPLLKARMGAEVWVKHENHGPTGAFKGRGGITFIDWLKENHPEVTGIISATRGNHGQAQARAGQKAGLAVTIVVPQGNSEEKNAAMRAFGAEIIEHGHDFEAARLEAVRLSEVHGLYMVPSYHRELVRGVATYGMELFDAAGELDTVYVAIGLGSGICAVIAARDALGLKTEIVGVVSTGAQGAKLSFEAGHIIATNDVRTFADGVAVRVPNQVAFDIYSKSAARIIAVDDDLIAEAMRVLWQDTHNLAEGAGAVPMAGLLAEKDIMRGKRVGVILCGGNVDQHVAATVLGGSTPRA